MNLFVEGLQGSGKSTLTDKLAKLYPAYRLIKEGDYSPIELAWCAYVCKDTFDQILERYPDLSEAIRQNSVNEDEHIIICYTKIRTDNSDFYKDLERCEIYNNRTNDEQFKNIIISRFKNFNDDGLIFECSLFQNIVEDMILFRNMSDEQIISFYAQLKEILKDKDYLIYYLISDDIESNFEIIRKQRTDEKGNEVWYEMMLDYFNNSPYAASRNLSGEEELIKHFYHRQQLELTICRQLFNDRCRLLQAKNYSEAELLK